MQSGGVTQDAHEEEALLQEVVHGINTLLFSQDQKYVYLLLLSVCEISTLHVKLRIA